MIIHHVTKTTNPNNRHPWSTYTYTTTQPVLASLAKDAIERQTENKNEEQDDTSFIFVRLRDSRLYGLIVNTLIESY